MQGMDSFTMERDVFVNDDQMGGEYSVHWWDEICAQYCGSEKLKRRDKKEGLGVVRRKVF